MWLNEEDSYEWYIRYVKEIREEYYLVDHLKQEFRSSYKKRKYPTKSDENVVERKQILEVGVEGEWSLMNLRNCKFMLENSEDICSVFNKFCNSY